MQAQQTQTVIPSAIKGRETNLPIQSADITRQAIGMLSRKNKRKYRTRNVRSVMLLSTSTRDFDFFGNMEDASVKKYANYPTSGLISTPTGMLIKVTAEIFDADLKPVNYAGGTTPFAKYYEVQRLINSFDMSYHKDNAKRKDFSLSEAHKSLFRLIEPGQIGTPTNVALPAAVLDTTEGKEQGINLLSELSKTSSTVIKCSLPTGSPNISEDLASHLLVVTALIAEEDIG
ncbi:MAG: hypothetical protein KDK54_19670 [Leptospiraceae bacterium]|nr:hypothetical protein [Leptospiraceae bacterium]